MSCPFWRRNRLRRIHHTGARKKTDSECPGIPEYKWEGGRGLQHASPQDKRKARTTFGTNLQSERLYRPIFPRTSYETSPLVRRLFSSPSIWRLDPRCRGKGSRSFV